MENEIFPSHYKSWKRCITQKCKIPLTKEYITKRIAVLSQEGSQNRKIFIEKYGLHWTNTILGYFYQAMNELENK